MRISDWSSDVCSSDLGRLYRPAERRLCQIADGRRVGDERGRLRAWRGPVFPRLFPVRSTLQPAPRTRRRARLVRAAHGELGRRHGARTSTVAGQSVSVRVDLAGSGITKKKTTITTSTTNNKHE